MDDLKGVTVSYLRDLARKHLGPGYSKLTKTQLIAALAHFVPALKKLAEVAGLSVAKAARKTERKQESAKQVPEKKREPERKKEPEGKKVAQKKNPEGKKGAQKKGPEAKKTEAKKAVEKKEPARKAAPPPQQKATPPAQKKAPAPPEQKAAPPEQKAAPPEQKKVAPPEPKAAQPEPKASVQPEPKASVQPEPKASVQPEQKAPVQPEPKATAPEQKPAASRERKPTPGRSATTKVEELAQSLRPAQVVNFPPRPRSYRSADGSWNEDPADTAAERAAATASHPAEPLLEGFFVARVAGERELRRHHLTEDQAPRAVTSTATGYEENLGALPVDYASDVAMALARDPHTLFVSWDFTPATRARAMEGLDSPRPVLRVYEGDKLVRVEEFALESHSFYIHGLPPGRSYRVEIHFAGRDGRSRRIGPSTHPVRLPQSGLSQDTAVRFIRLPPPPPPTGRPVAQQPLAVPPEPTAPSFVDEGEFITWHRVPLPSSADVAEVQERRRERVQRQAGVPPRPAHLQISARPLGASELAAVRGLRLGGASEQIHWTPPPSGRGR